MTDTRDWLKQAETLPSSLKELSSCYTTLIQSEKIKNPFECFYSKFPFLFRANNQTAVLDEAEKRISKLCYSNFKIIANELRGCDQYQYMRAVSAGVQEFIEAYTFFEYLREKELSDWKKIEDRFVFDNEDVKYQFQLLPSVRQHVNTF